MNAHRIHAVFAATVLLLAGRGLAQGGGLRGPSTVTQGGTMEIEVGTNDPTVEVSTGGPETSSHSVPPGRKVTIPVPPVPGGTILFVTVGRGLRIRVILVEVIAP
ncbi:MAG TPA: hypothetical protein VFZ65_01035 [Planctomycetota bacterium]|nr:hypothetical protein [Planctomycetota bacterium]